MVPELHTFSLHDVFRSLVFDIRTGADTKITRLAFAGNTNPDKPYSGPVYEDNIRVYEGSFHGIKPDEQLIDRKSTRLNSSHGYISYAVFCLKKKNEISG